MDADKKRIWIRGQYVEVTDEVYRAYMQGDRKMRYFEKMCIRDRFTSELCKTLDNMMDGDEEPKPADNSETLFARINHRLTRLYQIMQENRRKVEEERQELQTLVSDISHQVKTPVSNLKMVTDTLLTRVP